MQKKQLFIIGMVMAAGTLLAQESQEPLPPQKRVSHEQMTQMMVNDLKLDTKQQKKVAKLNKKYQTLIEGEEHKAPDFGRPPMGKRPQGGPGEHGGFGGGMPPRGGFGGGMPGGPRGSGMPGGHHSEKSYDFDKKQQKYDKAIAKILSDEQMEGYKKIKPMFASQCRIKEFLLGDDLNFMKDGDFE
jgi:hypothetical protein